MIIALAVNLPGDENRLKPKPTALTQISVFLIGPFCLRVSDLGESRVVIILSRDMVRCRQCDLHSVATLG